MNGQEIKEMIKNQKSVNHCFIKWWRKENDFLDYDRIDRFMERLSGDEEFGGIELMTMDEMWLEVQRVAGTRVKMVNEKSGNKVEWEHVGKTGMHKQVCEYCPETLMTIYDVETRGNPVDA
jgi:hypothetical protein